jgi:hypothetical protein
MYSVVIDSITAPTVADQNKLWHKRIDDGASGSPTGRLYQFYLGKWVSPHPDAPSTDKRIWWEGSLSDLGALDGGVLSDPVTETTGPFWEEDTNYQGRFPLHYGTVGAYVFASGGTGGNIEISLAANTMPPHEHYIANTDDPPGSNTAYLTAANSLSYMDGGGASSVDYVLAGTATEPTVGLTSTTGGDGAGATVPFNIMPRYRVGLWAKRTARRYLVG